MTGEDAMPPVGFTIRRIIDASPERVWRMWTEPNELVHWLHPDDHATPMESIHVDVRVGGRLNYTLVDGTTGGLRRTAGVFLEVDPGRRLVFTWGTPEQALADADDITTITVSLLARGDRTELTLDVRGVLGGPGDGNVYDGWDQALRGLASHAPEKAVTARTLHIGLRVADREKSVAFYRSLGYQVIGTVAGTPLGHLTMLKLPMDEFVTIELVSGAFPSGAEHSERSLSHLVIATESLDDAIAHLETEGIAASDTSVPRGPDAVRTTHITDPDGNPIELVQWPAGHLAGMTAADFRREGGNDEDPG